MQLAFLTGVIHSSVAVTNTIVIHPISSPETHSKALVRSYQELYGRYLDLKTHSTKGLFHTSGGESLAIKVCILNHRN